MAFGNTNPAGLPPFRGERWASALWWTAIPAVKAKEPAYIGKLTRAARPNNELLFAT